MKNLNKIIKFEQCESSKYYQFDKLQFFAFGNNREGYRLKVFEYYLVPDEYIANKYYSRHYPTNFERKAVNIAEIRKQILEVIENYYKTK